MGRQAAVERTSRAPCQPKRWIYNRAILLQDGESCLFFNVSIQRYLGHGGTGQIQLRQQVGAGSDFMGFIRATWAVNASPACVAKMLIDAGKPDRETETSPPRIQSEELSAK